MTHEQALAEIARLQTQLAIANGTCRILQEQCDRAQPLADMLICTLQDVTPDYADSEQWAERRLGTLRERVQTTAPHAFPY